MEHHTRYDFIVGTVLSFFGQNALQVIAFAALGATTSFFVSMLWKMLFRSMKKKPE